MKGTKMDKLLTMSEKELSRLEIMKRLEEKRLRQGEAAKQLGVSVRHVKRLQKAYRGRGAEGLISKRRGKPSNNRLKAEKKQEMIDLIRKRYEDFGPTLAHEKLTEVHAIKISVESVRQMMIVEKLWKPRRAKREVVHQMRERRACLGELVQIDGSPYDWFEGRAAACSLLVFIDDATGQLMELYFTPTESMFSYSAAVRRYLAQHGKPVAFYSDKHGIFRVNNKNALSGTGMTQFGRAMKDLDIHIICANTPQAKGRVERANQTLQDRLVKEMRLLGISSIEAGNEYVQVYIQEFNRRFSVVPRGSHDAHRPLQPTDDLDRSLTKQETRILSKNLTFQYKKVVYQIITSRPSYALRKARVTVCENALGNISVLYKGHSLAFSVFHKQQHQAEVVSSKSIDHKLKQPWRPAEDHPWRNYTHPSSDLPISERSHHGAD
jgi:transposase